jgi:hypothetical protein
VGIARGHALECVQWARKAKDETDHATFFDMVRAWLRAALVIDDTLPSMDADVLQLHPGEQIGC